MQIDFKALEQALAPISEIGQGELTFDAGGTTITVRVLRPHEEVDAQKYAAQALDGDAEHAAVDYLDRFRLACLSYAIVAVGSQDFRNVDFVTTGDTLEGGAAVKVPKYKAMRELLGRWTRAALAAVFTKFHELLSKTEKEAEKAIVFEPSDTASEIDRLQQRIKELQSDQAKMLAIEKLKFTDTVGRVEALVADSAQILPSEARVLGAEAGAQADPPPAAPPPRRTGPIIPQQAAPPLDRATPPLDRTPPPSAVVAHPTPPPEPAPPARADTSFINLEDDDSMSAALDAEHYRLLDMRRRAVLGQQQEGGANLDAVRPQMQQGRRPPHLDAADTDADVGLMNAVAQRAREMGYTAEGVPVYAMPAQDLDVPASRLRPDRGALNPQTQAGGSTNPRFQGPRRP